jgi:hypothetical protein
MNVFNESRLKCFHPPAFPNQPQASLRPDPRIEEENGPKHEVEEVVGKRMTEERGVEYLVRWKSYGLEDNTWELVAGSSKARKAVCDFESRG